ncbi:MAG: rhomboid family intramembrane serine protease, partial [Myxococcales bacterium]|nr:rhomboid family intramembrane serine protease [Myxococcales bacterium]
GMLGARWLLGLYFIGALGGSTVSVLLNDGSMVSVGASGAIMGLFAAGIFLAISLPEGQREGLIMMLARVLVPSLLPFLAVGEGNVDYGGHLGGALAGALAGALLLRSIRAEPLEEGSTPSRQRVATPLAFSFIGASSLALLGVVSLSYPRVSAAMEIQAKIIPNSELPEGPPPPGAIEGWLERYPEDPRGHLLAAQHAIDEARWESFEGHLALARAGIDGVAGLFHPEWPAEIRAQLDALERDALLLRELLPNAELPQGEQAGASWAAHLDVWLERHPHDPRVLEQAAGRALDASRFEEAEAHARLGLEQAARFEPVFPGGQPSIPWLRALRGLALEALGRGPEARPLFDAVCVDPRAEGADALLRGNGRCQPPAGGLP